MAINISMADKATVLKISMLSYNLLQALLVCITGVSVTLHSAVIKYPTQAN